MQGNKIFKIDDEYSVLTEELLRKEYCENKITDKQIAIKYNIGSKVDVWRRRKFFNIENRLPNKSNKNAKINRLFSISIDTAKEYLQQNLSYEEIAKKMGCSRMVVYRRFKELGLITDQVCAMKKLKWHESISGLQNRFLLGCILGDGNITAGGMFRCSHSIKQKQYLEYKFNLLKNLTSPNFKLKIAHNLQKNGKTYYSISFRTMQNEYIKNLYSIFYQKNIKIFQREYLVKSCFDAYSLAIWYMDDGARSYNSANLYTYGFGTYGNIEIIKFLKKKFNLEAEIKSDNRPQRNKERRKFLHFTKTNAEKFFSLVAPHILPYFSYKLPEKFRF
jgi:hypothetical protein